MTVSVREQVEQLGARGARVETINGLTRFRTLDTFWLYADSSDWGLLGPLAERGSVDPWVTGWILENVRAGSRVLDLGAGRGYYALVFGSLGCHVTALDRDPARVGLLARSIADSALGQYVVAEQRVLGGGDTSLARHHGVPAGTTLDELADVPADVVRIGLGGAEELLFASSEAFRAAHQSAIFILEWRWSRYADAEGFARFLLENFSVGYVNFSGTLVALPAEPRLLRSFQFERGAVVLVLRPLERPREITAPAPAAVAGGTGPVTPSGIGVGTASRPSAPAVPVVGAVAESFDVTAPFEAVVPRRSPTYLPGRIPLRSETCTFHHYLFEAYDYWAREMGDVPRFHRKQWEYFFIAQALFERSMLTEGRRGLGFGVGQEPLVALFASRGCSLLATDLAGEEAIEKGWATTNQFADSLEEPVRPEVCDPALFRRRVELATVDMTAIPSSLRDFDFCWSSSAFGHLGSIEAGVGFVEKSLETLRPGGVAVHTTEFLLDPGEDTVEMGPTVIFRRSDIARLIARLTADGHEVEPLVIHRGGHPLDDVVDHPPYSNSPHLKLRLMEHDSTSVALIVRKRRMG